MRQARAPRLRIVTVSLLRQQRRLALAVLAIALGVGYLAGALTLLSRVGAGLDRLAVAGTEQADLVVVGEVAYESPTEKVRALVPDALVDQISRIDGVAAAVARLEDTAVVVGSDGRPVVPLGLTEQPLAVNWPEDPSMVPYPLMDGGTAPGEDEVVLDEGTARRAGVEVGDTVGLAAREGVRTLTVSGILDTGDTLPGAASLALIESPTARAMFAQDLYVNRIAIRLEPEADLERVRSQVSVIGGVEVLTGEEATEDRISSLTRSFAAIRWLVTAFAVLALLVASVTVGISLSLLFVERSRSFAMLRLAGARQSTLLAAGLLEVLLVAGFASLLGLPTGWVLGRVLESVVGGVGTPIPVAGATVVPAALATAAVCGVGIALLAGLGPVRRAASVPPILAVTDQRVPARPGTVRRVLGLPARMLGAAVGEIVRSGARGADPTMAVSSRNIRERPGRTAATVAALGTATAVLVLISVVLASFTASLRGDVDRVVTADLVVDSGTFTRGGLPNDLVERLRATQGVAAVSGIAVGRGWVQDRPARFTGVSGSDLFRLLRPATEPADVATIDPGSILLAKPLAEELGVAAGDRVMVQFTSGGVQSLEVAAVFTEGTGLLGEVVMDRSTLTTQIPTTVDILALVDLMDDRPGDERDAAINRVRTVARTGGVAGVHDPREFLDERTELLEGAQQVIRWMLLFTLLQALVGVVNTFLLSVSERLREFGLLRVAGASPRRLGRMVLREGLALSAVAAVLGTAVGVLGARMVVSGLAAFGFGTFSLPAIVLLIVIPITALGTLAAWWPARVAARSSALDLIADSGERRLRGIGMARRRPARAGLPTADADAPFVASQPEWVEEWEAAFDENLAAVADREDIHQPDLRPGPPAPPRPPEPAVQPAMVSDFGAEPTAVTEPAVTEPAGVRRMAARSMPSTLSDRVRATMERGRRARGRGRSRPVAEPIFVPLPDQLPATRTTHRPMFTKGTDTRFAGLEHAFLRLSPASRWEGREAVRIVAAVLHEREDPGESVRSICSGILNGHVTIAALTNRRLILAMDRDGHPVVDSVPLQGRVRAQMVVDSRGRGNLLIERGDAHLVIRHIRDVSRAGELMERLNAQPVR